MKQGITKILSEIVIFAISRVYVSVAGAVMIRIPSRMLCDVKCGAKIPKSKCSWKYFDRHLPVRALCWFCTHSFPLRYTNIYICNKFKGDRIRRTQRTGFTGQWFLHEEFLQIKSYAPTI